MPGDKYQRLPQSGRGMEVTAMSTVKKGYLILEDGHVFEGALMEGSKNSSGEVVFNTSAFGYEQILTDPSYAGQIVVMTYPLIGNYGVSSRLLEADRPWVKGFVVRGLNIGEHYEKEEELKEFLQKNQLACISGIDTRALTRLIRNKGTMGGLISDTLDDLEDLIRRARAVVPPPEGFVRQVSRKDVATLGSGDKRIVLVDYGTKKSIASSIVGRGCELIIVPADTPAHEIMQISPDGLVLSNGPGDPAECDYAIKAVKELIGSMPILGICLGHQILSLALGANTRKMVFGHRGSNHPVKDMRTGKIYITAQNHGYVADESSLAGRGVDVLFKNLNDGTVEGIIHRELPIMSVQFHPEASPGPIDTAYILDDFIESIKGNTNIFLDCG
ncbi:carbamoyl-phosphate synthase small chain [hydrocarbon metagenome]|uniref:carbamoyl-phosphate synthase (glutamine-hydrolyzing) n=1 Tax=hydrocarbon metagenome TaxID=938273 RepID=A0A0W8E6B6_9ZZZZ